MSTPLDERIFEATVGALELFGVYLGTRLGLYVLLRDREPLSAAELAEAAGISPRYAQEWLEQQAVAGMLTVDGTSRTAEERRFALPAEHAAVLTDPDATTHVAPFADMVVGIAGALDEVVAAFRDGSGVPFAHYGAALRRGQGGINRPAFRSELVEAWLPAVPDLHRRLNQPGARVADVGCGHGWSTIALAQSYPQVEVIGYDADAASVEDARGHARTAGVDVRFVQADASTLPADGPFDAMLMLEALHDLARPVDVLTSCRKALAADACLLVADEAVAEQFTAPGDPLERMMYGWSISHCLPASMAEQPSAAIGTAIRPDTVRALATDAGFGSTEIVAVDGGFFRLYRMTP